MNILRKMADAVRRLLPTATDGWSYGGSVGDSGEVVNEGTALSLSSVWACVNLLSGTISSLPLMVYKPANGSRMVATDHPLYRILHDSPNFDQTAVDFWDFMCSSLELWGNAFGKVERSGNKVVAVTPINPAHMAPPRRLANGSIEYRWTSDGVSYVETDRTILHIRGFGGNPLGGVSTLQVARNSMSLARSADRAAAGMFKNGLRPSGVLMFEKWLSPEQRVLAETKMLEKFDGAMGSGKPMVLEGGTKWEQLTISPEDAQMLQSRSFSVEEICRFFGVPPFMIGHTEKTTSWGTGLEQQTLGFQKFTLRRRLKRIEQALEKQLLTAEDRARGITIEFNIEGLLRGDSAGRAKFYQSMTAIGAMTINEVRALENMPPVPGGDVPRIQMQNVPVGTNDQPTDALPPPDQAI